MIVVNPTTRQFNIPGADLVFGVTDDSGAEVKHFQCPRLVGNNLDIASSFVRINYRNANGEIDSHLISDIATDGSNVTFSWELHPKVTRYKGNIVFVMCVVGPDTKVKWHTTLGRGQVLEGLEPDSAVIEAETEDVIAQLIAMMEAQTEAVEKTGADQVVVVKAAAKTAQDSAVSEIESKGVNTLDSIPKDYTAMQNTVDGLTRGRAGAIVCEAEGSAIAVNDASDLHMQGLRVFGRSTQDGVPTPEAPVEIKSVENPTVTLAGKNLVDFVSALGDGYAITLNGITAVLKNGVVTTSGTNEYDSWTDVIHTRDIWGIDKYVLPAGTYTVPVGMNVITTDLVLGTSKNVRGTFVQSNLFCVRGFYITYNRGETANDRIPLVMVRGTEVPTNYEPYKTMQNIVTTHPLRGIPVTANGNYTDENGQQWFCDEVDLERGVYVHRLVKHELSSGLLFSSWTNGEKEIGVIIRGLKWDYSPRTEPMAICSHFEPDLNGSIKAGQLGFRLLGDYPYIYLLHTEGIAMTADEWRAFFDAQIAAGTPVTLVIKAESVTETPLSETEIAAYRALHSNYPNTTVLNDAGAHMSVKYAADTKLYIDNKIAALMGNT